MRWSVSVDPDLYDGFCLTTDYVARGAFPLGSDGQYLDKYYSPEVVAQSYDEIVRLPSAIRLPPSDSFSGRLLNSPIHLSVAGLSLDQANSYSELFIYRWLDWLASADKVDARQRGAINTRDDKLRQFAFKGNCANAARIVGPQAGDSFVNSFGAACTGPLAEAYVGGGS